MGLKKWILASSVVAVISLLMSPSVADQLASTQVAAIAAPYISHAVAWMSGLPCPNILTFFGVQAIFNKIMGGTSVPEMMKEMRIFFENVGIKKKNVHEVEREMKGDLVESWDEKVFQEASIGIPVDKFEEFVNNMISQLGMKKEASEKLKEQFMQMLYLDSKERKIWDFVIDEGALSSHYGYVSFKKDSREKIDAVYAIHALHAKMADQWVERSETEYVLLVIPWSTVTWEEREPYRFGTKDIDKSRTQYLKNRALESFKENGLLEEIKYIE